MRAVDVRVAALGLGQLVDQVRTSGEPVTITTPGGSAAVLMSIDEFDSLQETLVSLSSPGALEELRQADRDYSARQHISGDELRLRYGLPERQGWRSGSASGGVEGD